QKYYKKKKQPNIGLIIFSFWYKSASKQLRIWININTRLSRRLLDCGYISKQRIITPAQVKIIVEELGEPG
ncbi:MAG: DUF4248 domain-containing protein, partial [Limnohabitans sp.]|nr:DUF4248 domain-containing protein [Limnohabitans sp.]